MTVSIRNVAEDVVTLETCVAAPARFPEGVAEDRERNPFLGWETSPATPRLWRLRDVVLDRSLMVLMKDGAVIAETNYLQAEDAVAALRVREDRLIVADPGVAVVPCCDHWDANYYHWVAHALPTVHAVLLRHPDGDAALLGPRLSAWQSRAVELAGGGHLFRIAAERDAQYFLPLVEYVDFVAGRADFAVSALSRSAYSAMAGKVALDTSLPRLIYIDRGATTNRSVPNEAALAARLREVGFQPVRPETLSIERQIALFKGAAMVVGQLGSGLANIAFCTPGTVVYELVPEHHRNPCFLAMAMQGGLNYWADLFPTGVQGEDHTSAWSVPIDLDQVMRRVAELLLLIPASRRPR